MGPRKVTFERCALFGESFIGDSSICYTVCGISGQKVKTSYSLYSCPLLESQKRTSYCVLYIQRPFTLFLLQGCYLWFLSFPLLMLVAMIFTEYWRHKASVNSSHLSPVSTDLYITFLHSLLCTVVKDAQGHPFYP